MSSVEESLASVQARVAAACARAQRPPDSVQLIAVSKLQPKEKIRAAYAAGQRHFGENYAQELRDKAADLTDLADIRWHALGALQTNKVKYVAQSAHAYHALARLSVAQELSRRRTGAPLPCFLEVNLGGESTKEGVEPGALAELLAAIRALPHLEVVGLMALPPLTATPEEARPHFRRLRALAAELSLPRLSMGTTHDFEVAVEEGATDVRVGEAIFGPRPAAVGASAP